MSTLTGSSVMVMSSTVARLMAPPLLPSAPSAAKPAIAVEMVPRVVAMDSQARNVRSLAKYVLGSMRSGILRGSWYWAPYKKHGVGMSAPTAQLLE